MLGKAEILAALDRKNVKNVDIEKALGLPSSRVSELRAGSRNLKLEEAVKLVEAFKLEPPTVYVSPLSLPIARMVVHHVANVCAASLEETQVQELAEDLQAFGRFVADPRVRDNMQSVQAFFHALELRRTTAQESAAQ